MSGLEISLAGKAMIVTGASSGIGARTAAVLAAAGAEVAIVGRDAERLAITAEKIRGSGRDPVVIEADLLVDGAPAQVVEQALAGFGRLDALVNCAGIFELAPFEESLGALDRQWECNVRAPFALTQAAIRHLRESGGTVLFLSSLAGRVGVGTGTAYCAVKGGVENLVRALAIEEAPNGVRVNAIAPGNVHTAMNEGFFADPEFEKAMLALTPLGRIGEVDDIAPAAAFLVSDAAGYITGQSLVIDGGWSAQ
ncbi:MAG: 2,5-dichloro-2,5-cyclohexadiene-1,4-diol dehydrogenase [Solirubrobacterales bacterium 70-9]|nr:MAG: 2,5-dichloro-2,5-cyclohexadiene-1,4-diol dehydrogenase [Solirubrobacterales bacterium 70-9]